jgi:coenzyme F420 hydrogenase subunit beta
MGTAKLPTIQTVVDEHMCSGCGGCAFANPGRIQMQDTLEHGRRPVSINGSSLHAFSAQVVCPSVAQPSSHDDREKPDSQNPGLIELRESWGPVLEIWEGHATDSEIRHRGSSGGVTTALALYAVEQQEMQGVVHVRAKQDAPLLNETVVSTDRSSLLAGSGSRYSPASPCEGLDRIAEGVRPSVFIGKPCDIAATAKARSHNAELDEKLGLTLAIFCAGTPSIQGTIELARRLGVDSPEQISSVRYRGQGWPGKMTVTYKDDSDVETTRTIDYSDGWGEILQKHRQWRCHVCPDHTGEHSDISVGDPWYRPIAPGEAGSSLVLVRTERGRQLVRQAMAAGYVELSPRESWVMNASQPHLLHSQGAVWGRAVAMRMAGIRTPLVRSRRRLLQWIRTLSLRQKVQSVLGTLKRIRRKRLKLAENSKRYTMVSATADTEFGSSERGETVTA